MSGAVVEQSWVGVDLGGDRSTTVLQSGEIVRSELGGHDTATLVAFKPRERLVGEAAVSMATSSPTKTISALYTMAGVRYSDWSSRILSQHLPFSYTEALGDLGGVAVSVEREGGKQTYDGTELLAMFLAKLRACAEEKLGSLAKSSDGAGVQNAQCKGSLSSPDYATAAERRALVDAAHIAGFGGAKVFRASDCMCAAYARKHPVPPGAEPETVLMVDMGRLHTTVVLARFGRGREDREGGAAGDGDGGKETRPAPGAKGTCKGSFEVLHVESDEDLGALTFDHRMFEHFRKVVKGKHGQDVMPKTKQGLRLLLACRRLRELLSTTPVAETAVENLVDGVDVPLSMTRAELASLCKDEAEKMKSMVRSCLEGAGITAASLNGAQAVGGGCRMPLVQAAVAEEIELSLGSKMDSACIAYGAALLAEDGSVPDLSSVKEEGGSPTGMSTEALGRATEREKAMQRQDAEVQAAALERNGMESLLFDMRSAPNKKHGQLLNRESLDSVLDGLEEWLYSEAAEEADLSVLKAKRQKVDNELKNGVAKEYFEALDEDRRKAEAEIEAHARAAEEERRNNPEEEVDHDNRKLPKPERMRLVVKNKEEGTELFKGQNYRSAGARYSKALTHAAKMFDLNAEEKKEVEAVQLSLYLNLAQVTNNCALALKIDAKSSKALYRRAYALVAKKDYEAAKADLLLAQKSAPGDKAVATLLKKVEETLKKQQEKEKKMWSKAFA